MSSEVETQRAFAHAAERGLRLAIIADDLTGALDASAPFAGRGLTVTVALGPEHLPAALATRPDIIAISTASRDIPASDAAKIVRATLDGLPSVRLFKKIDSRLKGNIAAELSAFRCNQVLLAPAIPEFGRIQQDGHIQGFGVENPIPMRDCLGDMGAGVEIPDITSTVQMRDALAASRADLLIGARGLADALAAQMTGCDLRLLDALPGPNGLFLVGSRDPITMAQVDHLRRRTGAVYIGAPNGHTAKAPPAGPCVILQAVPGPDAVSGAQVADRLAAASAPVLRPGFGTVLLTGGATAEAVLRARSVGVLHIRGECLPGLVASDADGLTIVTKSGGFGDADSLSRIAAMIGGGQA